MAGRRGTERVVDPLTLTNDSTIGTGIHLMVFRQGSILMYTVK